jgi:hypothetical protein
LCGVFCILSLRDHGTGRRHLIFAFSCTYRPVFLTVLVGLYYDRL